MSAHIMSTEILRKRDDDGLKLHFEFYRGDFMHITPHRHPEKRLLIYCNNWTSAPGPKSLNGLVNCLRHSQQLQRFPCTEYEFDEMPHVRGEDMQNFLQIFGENIRSLKIGLRDGRRSEIIDDILESTPNLKKLEIVFLFGVPWNLRFPDSISVGSSGKLLNLEVLSFNVFWLTQLAIIEKLLKRSPQLKRILFGLLKITPKVLQMLELTNKLNCLKNVRIHISKNIIAHWKKSLQCFDLQLESLSVTVSKSVMKDPLLKLDATKIIRQLFDSSKDVMQTLGTDMLKLLSELQLPRLEKIEALYLYADFRIVPPFLDWLKSFPNIKTLYVDLVGTGERPAGSLESQQIRLPSVEFVRIRCEEKRDIRNLIRMTPNAKTLLIEDYTSFSDERIIVSFDEISTHVPKLVNFGWHLRRPNYHSQHKLDAVLTGLSENLCEELAVKFRNKNDGLSAKEIVAYQCEGIRSSILDLKDLRHLELDFDCNEGGYPDEEFSIDKRKKWPHEIGFDPNNHFYKAGITKVSKFLGFDLIPGLKVLICRS